MISNFILSFVTQGYIQRNTHILTQAPLDVMLNNLEEGEEVDGISQH